MPAALNVSVSFAVSSRMILSIAAGVSVTPIRNCALSLSCISGVFSASAQSLLILSRIAFGTRGWRHQAEPGVVDERQAGLGEGRHVRQFRNALRGRGRDGADLAGLRLVARQVDRREIELRVAADHRGHRIRRAAERHVDDVDAGDAGGTARRR